MPRPKSYQTAQSRALLDFLKKRPGTHYGVEELTETLRSEGISVGRTTVYRHLQRLVETGDVRRTTAEGRSACYSFGCCSAPHYHLHCKVCGRLIHADCAELDRLREHFLREHGFEIDPFGTTLMGRCADCIAKGEKNDGNLS